MKPKPFGCLSWLENAKYTWLFPSGASVTGWFGTKKSFSKIHPTKRQGSQQATSHKLWSERTVVAKQTLPWGKEKHSFGMWRKKGPQVGGGEGGMGGSESRAFIWFCGSWLSCTYCPEFLLDTIFFFKLKNNINSALMILWHSIF